MLMFVVGTSLPLRDPGLLGFGASALAALLTLVFAVPAGFGLALVGPDRPLVLAVVIATSSAAVALPILQGFNGSDATATTGSAHGNAAGGLAAAFARDQAMAPQCSGQPPDERGEYRPVRPVQRWPRVGSTEGGDLMAQHEQLHLLGGGRAAQQQDEPKHLPEDQIQKRAPRGAVVSDGGERPSVLCRRGGGVKLAAADPGIAGVGGSSRDKVGSVQDCRMGRAR